MCMYGCVCACTFPLRISKCKHRAILTSCLFLIHAFFFIARFVKHCQSCFISISSFIIGESVKKSVCQCRKGSFYLQSMIRDVFMLIHIMDKNSKLTVWYDGMLKNKCLFHIWFTHKTVSNTSLRIWVQMDILS